MTNEYMENETYTALINNELVNMKHKIKLFDFSDKKLPKEYRRELNKYLREKWNLEIK